MASNAGLPRKPPCKVKWVFGTQKRQSKLARTVVPPPFGDIYVEYRDDECPLS